MPLKMKLHEFPVSYPNFNAVFNCNAPSTIATLLVEFGDSISICCGSSCKGSTCTGSTSTNSIFTGSAFTGSTFTGSTCIGSTCTDPN